RVKLELYAAPLDADPFAEETIRLANPHYDDFMNQEEVRRQAQEARRMPSREAAYRNLVLNQRIEASDPFISRSVWELNGDPPGELEGGIFGGLDLSSTNDLTAMVLLGPGDGYWNVRPT